MMPGLYTADTENVGEDKARDAESSREALRSQCAGQESPRRPQPRRGGGLWETVYTGSAGPAAEEAESGASLPGRQPTCQLSPSS